MNALNLPWWAFALLSAFFAALTTIFAKLGVDKVSSNLATAIRTVVILGIAWGIVWFTGEIRGLPNISRPTWWPPRCGTSTPPQPVQAETILESEQHGAALRRVADTDPGQDLGDQGAAHAQPLGKLGTPPLGARGEQDQLDMQERRTAQRIFGERQWVLAAVGPATERRAAAWWKVMQP